MSNLEDLQQQAHKNARDKGFHAVADRLKVHVEELRSQDPELAALILSSYYSNRLMLIVGELSEAHEELRTGHLMSDVYVNEDGKKPEGVPVELADVGIRLMDLSEEAKISLENEIGKKMNFNSERPQLHGNKTF